MALKTNSAGRKLYVVVNALAGVPVDPLVILKRNALWPNAIDDSPISGDDGTVKYLATDETLAPDYDSRLFKELLTEGPDGDIWRIVHTVEKRDADEIALQISNREGVERAAIVPQQDFTASVVIAISAVFRRAKNLTLTDEEQAAVDSVVDMAAKVSKNRANRDAKIAAVLAGNDPAIDEGWEPNP